ncbi:MAG: transcriptional regulator, partial [Burkholderiales bacterium]|nr:transcriptional regulator [Burkholderiales bacterium]
MRKLWLLFAQTVTVSLGVYFVVATLRPDLLPAGNSGGNSSTGNVVTIREAEASSSAEKAGSYSAASG